VGGTEGTLDDSCRTEGRVMSAASQYEFLVLLLVAIVVLELVARRLHLPPAAAFIIGGIVLALARAYRRLRSTPISFL
jgi:monovalent cation/hydrogen antiporter